MAFVSTEFGPWGTDPVGSFHAIHIDALDFKKAAAVIAELAEYVEDVKLPLRGVKKIMVDDIKERFDSETDPAGDRWIPLTPDYAKRKQKKYGDRPILTRDRDLRTKATNSAAFTVTGESIFYNAKNLPEYWRVHQQGSEDYGTHFHAGAFSGALELNEISELEFGEGQNIPPRAFIGVSAEAEAKILELFDIWFSEGIELASKRYAISSVGVLHERINGRFGPKIEF